ncbi:hypothetical protein [Sporisorium scitamineum]|uniref:Uncharacterized protein n=1 Tax=Sporisorium scitamineum TaxID=49012 RepID=A0A0F7S166_9BASI|nr:hypothetical protein [Sporisorium scitamineum]
MSGEGTKNAGAGPRLKYGDPPAELRQGWVRDVVLANSLSAVGAVIEVLQECLTTGEDLRNKLEQARDALHIKDAGVQGYCPLQALL